MHGFNQGYSAVEELINTANPDVFDNLWYWRERFPDCECLIAGDFNADLNNVCDDMARYVNSFISSRGFTRADIATPYFCQPTYVNFALNHTSCIDYVLTSNAQKTSHFETLDPDMKFSDHLPIAVSVCCSVGTSSDCSNNENKTNKCTPSQYYLRWDKADNNAYYLYTGHHLQPILRELDTALMLAEDFSSDQINTIYDSINLVR